MSRYEMIVHTSVGNIKVTLEPLVDAGKAMIQEDARVLGVESATARKAPEGAKRIPQVGDFWETSDGSRVYLPYRRRRVDNAVSVLKVAEPSLYARGGAEEYLVTTDGAYVGIDGGCLVHPLNLKRFIGR